MGVPKGRQGKVLTSPPLLNFVKEKKLNYKNNFYNEVTYNTDFKNIT
jgi:hypothetical protein